MCPTCPDSGGHRAHVGHSNPRVLRVLRVPVSGDLVKMGG